MDEAKAAEGFWVFAYGSLMWNPGFAAEAQVLARLDGFHRSFCMSSVVYRGTPEAPGLVLALDRAAGAACSGVGYFVAPREGVEVLGYLRERELVSSAYREEMAPVALADGRRVEALCYVMDRAHEQYRDLTAAEQAAIIARAAGPAGSNREYLLNTVSALHRLGLSDPDLEALAAVVRRMI
ncbi:MAG: gamma-glutamylcyclotransferase [Pseudomonadota bacterium]